MTYLVEIESSFLNNMGMLCGPARLRILIITLDRLGVSFLAAPPFWSVCGRMHVTCDSSGSIYTELTISALPGAKM